MADRLEERHPELEAAEFEAERPARELSGLPSWSSPPAAGCWARPGRPSGSWPGWPRRRCSTWSR
jgi:hypothetical protein